MRSGANGFHSKSRPGYDPLWKSLGMAKLPMHVANTNHSPNLPLSNLNLSLIIFHPQSVTTLAFHGHSGYFISCSMSLLAPSRSLFMYLISRVVALGEEMLNFHPYPMSSLVPSRPSLFLLTLWNWFDRLLLHSTLALQRARWLPSRSRNIDLNDGGFNIGLVVVVSVTVVI